MAVGLNAVREVARRNPLALGEDLLQDLVQYKKHIDRGVTMAAKGIMQGEFFSFSRSCMCFRYNDRTI